MGHFAVRHKYVVVSGKEALRKRIKIKPVRFIRTESSLLDLFKAARGVAEESIDGHAATDLEGLGGWQRRLRQTETPSIVVG